MTDDQGYQRIDVLLTSLSARIGRMGAGSLDLEGLELAAEEVRELGERLIVLRHKAREKFVASRAPIDPGSTPNAPMQVVHEGGPIRLETQPLEGPRQITLIEAIEDQKGKKKKPKPAEEAIETPKKGRASVADKLSHAPISDLGKAIALSQKFWFTAELFGKDASTYERMVKRINGAGSLDDARVIVDSEVLAKLKKPPADDALNAFLELVERRFKA